MIAVDLPPLLLLIGLVTLAATTLAAGTELPTRRRRRRGRGREAASPSSGPSSAPWTGRVAPAHEATYRRPATGRPVELPPARPAARPVAPPPDDLPQDPVMRAAYVDIDRALDDEPERLAHMISMWIRSDMPDEQEGRR